MEGNKTAGYKIVSEDDGYRFLFYCDLSDAHVHTTKGIYPGDAEEALLAAWEREGKECFNRCHRCGKWVIDAMYNAEVLECVVCAPYETEPRFCKNCGHEILTPSKVCPACGRKLIYEGSVHENDAEGSL